MSLLRMIISGLMENRDEIQAGTTSHRLVQMKKDVRSIIECFAVHQSVRDVSFFGNLFPVNRTRNENGKSRQSGIGKKCSRSLNIPMFQKMPIMSKNSKVVYNITILKDGLDQ
eukprot:scaffold139065_cov20-Prasinocladus_malaysianus.AAC.1